VGDMLDPVFAFRLCGKLHTLHKQHRLVHIVVPSREVSELLSLGIFDMVCVCTQKKKMLREHRNCYFEIQNWKTMSITANISYLILNGRFVDFYKQYSLDFA
jgi:hypothetical protein